MTRPGSLLLLALLLAGTPSRPAHADDLQNVISDHSLTTWGQKDGLDSSVIWALDQDADGYLWLGTDTGAVRFDGVRFTPWDLLTSDPLPKVSVRSIRVARDGTVWFGFAEPGGVVRMRRGEVRVYGAKEGLASGSVTVLNEDPDGTIWAANSDGFHRYADDRWEGAGGGLPAGPVYSAYGDRTGSLLVGTPVGMFRRPREGRDFQPSESFESQVRSVAEDADGVVWLTDPIVGFRRIDERSPGWQAVEKGRGNRLLVDRRGNLWVGTLGQGLWRVRKHASRGTVVDKTTAFTGFSDDGVTALLEDREGNIWAATLDGLNRLTPHKVTPVLNLGLVSSVDVTPDGSVWVGTVDALIQFPDGDILSRKAPVPLVGAPLSAVHADERGTLWVATSRHLLRFAAGKFERIPLAADAPTQISSMTSDFQGGLWLYDASQGLLRWRAGRFQPVEVPSDVRGVAVLSSYSDRDGRVWLGMEDSRVARIDGRGSLAVYGPHQGLTAGPYRSIHQDRRGVVWFGGNDGLSRLTGDRFETLMARAEFPAESLTAIADDDDGHLWLATRGSGIIRIHEREIESALAAPAHPIRFSRYDKFDGFAGTPRWFGNRSAARAKDGRLWFVAGRGITVIDPEVLAEVQTMSFPVRIDGIVADHRRLAPTPELQLPPRTARLEIDYTALNLSAPLKTNFRYRLEGFDPEWVDAGTRRQAFYTNLPPRTYQFRVVSSRSDGTWDETGAVWAFTIQPMFHQTAGFLVACVLGAALAIGVTWRLHLRRIRKEFSLLLGERARLSREMHDTLLQSLFGVALQCDAMAGEIGAVAPALRGRLARLRHDVEEDIREARQSIWNLRSPRLESHDLASSLREVGERATASMPVTFTFESIGTPAQAKPEVEEQLLRIGREAVSNAVRHARAASIRIELAYRDTGITVSVRDDGVGFDPDVARRNGHYGLASMEERADAARGALRIDSGPGRGTVVEVTVPNG